MRDFWLLVRALPLLAVAFFVGGQLLLAAAVVPVERRSPDPERLRAIARRFGWGTPAAIAAVAALVIWHMRRPRLHAIEGAIFVVSLAIVWLGVELAHPY